MFVKLQQDDDRRGENSPPPLRLVDAPPAIPAYLEKFYWWAYVRPWAVSFFERPWLVNLILWGQYRALRDQTLDLLSGPGATGRTLQLACVYGDLTPRLWDRLAAAGGSLDVVDVLPLQLENTCRKFPVPCPVGLLHMDTSALSLPDASYDQALLFFLLHEQPQEVRDRTLAEAWRVLKSGGTLIIVDFSKPKVWNPLRYLWLPLLGKLEPFAVDLWTDDSVAAWLPADMAKAVTKCKTRGGGLYRIISLSKKAA